jgi:hypothetical protein
MEFFLEVLLTLFGDVLAGVLASVFDGRKPHSTAQQVWRTVGYVIFGALAAAVSMVAYPEPFLHSATAQRAWLFVSPFAAALAAFVFRWIFEPREKRGWPMVHAAFLAAAFTTFRFLSLQAR